MPGMPAASTRLLCAVVACVLAACAYERPRPAAWGPLPAPASTDCREFAGSFLDAGEATVSSGRASLIGTLFDYRARETTVVRVPDRVQFEFVPEAALRVTLFRDDQARFVRETKDFACVDGHLVVRDARMAAGAGAVGYETFVVTLMLGSDYVTARVEDSGVGVALLVPVVATATIWQRHRRVPG